MRSPTTNTAPGSAGQNGAHTPGPWRKCGGATPAHIAVHSARGYIVFGMADSGVHTEGLNRKPIKAPDMWEQQANARLIAAAPQLLEALKRMVRHSHETRGQAVVDAYASARTAIAAATGEAV